MFNPLRPILRSVLRVLSIILFILTLASAYGGYIPPYIWSTPSILTLALPWFAGATLVVGLAWLATGGLITAAMAGATLVASWGPVSTAVPLGHKRTADPDKKQFSIVSYNALYGADLELPEYAGNRAIEYILSTDADVVCLQEINTTTLASIAKKHAHLADSLSRRYPHIGSDPSGTLLCLSRYPLNHVATSEYPGEADVYSLKIDGQKLIIANVHLTSYALTPTERNIIAQIGGIRSAKRSLEEFKGNVMGKLKQSFTLRADAAQRVRTLIENISEPIIICGDFNDVPASWAYRKVLGDDMNDAYVETNFGPKSTYNASRLHFHIDQILYRGSIKALRVERTTQKNSDHYPLLATFEFTE